ncbi:MAG: hypothetical protein GTN49_10585 [candidate division Zixibacteria bacterium]|nr:hypothetical protein [candidate division Zixibacteria bacterium]
MRRLFIALPVFITSLAVINPASAERDLRHFGALGLGLGIPDDAAFRENYRQGFSGSLGYGTRLGRSGRFFAYGFLAYNRFRAKEHVRIGDDYFINFDANVRWYVGVPVRENSGYVGLGPGVYWDKDSNVFFGGNIAIGGDFPVGDGWSVTADIAQHIVDSRDKGAFLTICVGAAYWFM